jgi:alpha-amylase
MFDGGFTRRLLGLSLLAAAACAGAAHPAGGHEAPAAAAASPGAPDRAWSDDILYFVLVDRFADGDPGNDADVDRSAPGTFHGGDLKGLVAQIDEIASLGVTALWVNPLVRNVPRYVTGAGFPDWAYHGYWSDDLSQLDSRFGTEEDLATLVRECHRRGMKVLLDVVYNHAGYGTHYLADPRTRDWLRSTERGGCGDDDLTQCVAGLPDWKTERAEVAEWLLAQQLRWAERHRLDGFRLDTVKHVGHPFWQEHRRRARAALGPRFFLLGEVWGGDREVLDPYFEADELDAGFDFTFQGSAIAFVQGRGRAVAFDRYLASRERVRPGHLLAHYLSSHDVPGALFQLGGDRDLFRLAAVLQLTAAGLPVVYYGEEVARAGGDWPENRSDMPWGGRAILPGAGHPRDEAMRDFYRRLIAIRRAHPALRRGRHQAIATDGDLYVFMRRDPGARDTVVVAVNRGAIPAEASFPAPADWQGSSARDLLGGGEVASRDGRARIAVPARQARVMGVPRDDRQITSRGSAPN